MGEVIIFEKICKKNFQKFFNLKNLINELLIKKSNPNYKN